MPNYNTVVSDVGKQALLNDAISGSLNGAICRLFVNSPTINHSSTFADFTEPGWSGYAAQTLSAWSAPALDVSNRAFTTADPVNFNNTSGASETALGYWYTTAGGTYIGGAYFATPLVIPDGLFGQVTVTHTETAEYATSP